jgi:hypothetical protein
LFGEGHQVESGGASRIAGNSFFFHSSNLPESVIAITCRLRSLAVYWAVLILSEILVKVEI